MRASADSATIVRRREPPAPEVWAHAGADGRAAPPVARTGRRGREPRASRVGPAAFGAALAAALLIGWHNSVDSDLTPESGLGYWLGIAGAATMLLLLLYPLRKRIKALRGLGSISGWFRLHMALGLVGPALILLHSNFSLGSLNSNVALFSMLTVAASGLIGRYLYGRVHFGLHGRRTQIQDLLEDVRGLRGAMADGPALPPAVLSVLDLYAARALAERRGAASALAALLASRFRLAGERARLMRECERHLLTQGRQIGWSWRTRRKRARELRRLLRSYFSAVSQAAALAFYERLFALWHVLHLPLFALLVAAVVMHVIAVHLY